MNGILTCLNMAGLKIMELEAEIQRLRAEIERLNQGAVKP